MDESENASEVGDNDLIGEAKKGGIGGSRVGSVGIAVSI